MIFYIRESEVSTLEKLGLVFKMVRPLVFIEEQESPFAGDGAIKTSDAAWEVDIELPEAQVEVALYLRKDGEVILRDVLNPVLSKEVPAEFLNSGRFECDHCGANRERKSVWVARRKTDGKWLMLGRNCLGDLVGTSFTKYLRLLDLAQEAETGTFEEPDSDNVAFGGGAKVAYSYRPGREYLTKVATETRLHGWVSRSDAEASRYTRGESLVATVDAVMVDWIRYEPAAEDIATAEAAVSWYLAKEPPKEEEKRELYDNTRNILLAIDTPLHFSTLRRVAWVVNSYRRHLEYEEQKRRREAVRASMDSLEKFAATEGEKVDLNCSFLGCSTFENEWGTTWVWRLLLPGGVSGVWFSSKAPWVWDTTDAGKTVDRAIEDGETIHLRGTVKKWGEYKGEPQASFTRCTITVPGKDRYGKPLKAKKSGAKKRKASAETETPAA